MKKIIVFFATLLVLCANTCNPDLIPEQPLSLAKSEQNQTPDFTLMQEHFVTIRQIIHTLVINTNEAYISGYRFIDVHIAWLSFADGSHSNPKPYEICYIAEYDDEICYSTPLDLVGQTFVYNNGFEIGENIIKCEIQLESFDSVFFTVNNTQIEFSPPELKSCYLQPTNLTFTEIFGNTIKGIINLAFYQEDGNITDNLELPVELSLN